MSLQLQLLNTFLPQLSLMTWEFLFLQGGYKQPQSNCERIWSDKYVEYITSHESLTVSKNAVL
ncbi:CLUMA_CG007716, isoform A [Clunio marinus]|uniref:CLUMA_CG007716, isoform A n=1 Tax=Clunio marinus TaxID=568069 RepID=A0A1J1I1J9_9DIPT|nr:CLUMA_CG007716, isoform A [Clunio marinus]